MSQERSHSSSSPFVDASTSTAKDSEFADLPALQDVSDSEDSDEELEDNEATLPRAPPTPPAPFQAQPSNPVALKTRITAFWKVETAEEKAVRRERDARDYSERGDVARLREVDKRRKKNAKDRVNANERMRRHESAPVRRRSLTAGYRDKNDIETPSADPRLAEFSRPLRQIKEDAKKNNKPTGRKQKYLQEAQCEIHQLAGAVVLVADRVRCSSFRHTVEPSCYLEGTAQDELQGF
ncbi:hypothetical protein B0H19DRAFT_1245624 [Mycena capillaripes]|nr:hypothetical protein B0H19DRAFT_1245624 [Mycena capillaripes]